MNEEQNLTGMIQLERPNLGRSEQGEAIHAVGLYVHSCGPATITGALARGLDRGRHVWNDPDVLTRIIFCELMLATVGLREDAGAAQFLLTGQTMGIGITMDPRFTEATIFVSVDMDSQLIFGETSYEDYVQQILGREGDA